MKGVLTNRQIFLMLILLLSIDVFIDMPKRAVTTAGTGAWISILIAASVFAVGAFVITRLNLDHENKTILEYSTILVGKPLAYFIVSMLLVYFLTVFIVLLRDIAAFIKDMFLPLTPIWALVALFLSITVYAASKGITACGRMCEVIGIILIVTAFSTHAVMFMIGDVRNVLPLFEMEKTQDYILGIKDVLFAFLGIETLLLVPLDRSVNRKAAPVAAIAVLSLAVFYIVVVESSVMIMGMNDVMNYDFSLIEALRETRLPRSLVLERPDLLYLTVGVAAIIGGECFLYSIVVSGFSRLIPGLGRKWLLSILSVIVFVISAIMLNEDIIKLMIEVIIPVTGIITALVVPIVFYIISRVKKHAQ